MRAILFVFLTLISASTIRAQTSCITEEVCFNNEIFESEKLIPLRSMAEFRYYGFRVYSVGLYSESSKEDIKSWINEKKEPQSLDFTLHYERDFSAEDFIESGTEVIKENKTVSLSEINEGLTKINSLYKPVKAGDRYTIRFKKGEGITLLLNNLALGTIPGEEFARAYLGIWLSKYSLSERFTKKLLG